MTDDWQPVQAHDDDWKPVEPSKFASSMANQTKAEPLPWYKRFGMGAGDPVVGGTQLAARMADPEAMMALNQAGLDPNIAGANAPAAADAFAKKREADYQAQRAAAGQTGTDWARLAGNVTATLPMAAVGGGAATAAGRIGMSAASGGLAAALNPVTDGDDFWWEKGKQATIGAAGGAATAGAAEGVANVLAPTFRRNAQLLLDEGVTLTPGQMAGGMGKRAEDVAKSVPILGSSIRSGERRSIESFNRAAINRSLDPIGQRLPQGINMGHEAIDYAATRLGDAYDSLLPNLTARLDNGLQTEIGRISALGKNLPEAQSRQLDRIIENEILNRFTATGGRATGFTAKEIESELGQQSSSMMRSADYDVRRLGGAVKELQASIRRMVERVNPNYAGQLQQINRGWANLLRVQRAAGSVGAREGVFTPAQLLNSVKALDASKGKSAFSRGNALMQDLADAAKDVLPQSIPDSGTAGRLLGWDALVGGGSYLANPHIPLALGVASTPYTGAGMNLLRQWATALPATRNYLANSVRQGAMRIAPQAGFMAGTALAPSP